MAIMSMAQKIKELRKERGLTLEQVATVVGVGKSTVRKWETGMIANMKRDKIAALAQVLGTTPAYLLGWQDDEDENPHELRLLSAFDKLDIDNQMIVSNWVENYQKKPTPPVTHLTEGEEMLLRLFRQVPADSQQLVLQMIRAALGSQE